MTVIEIFSELSDHMLEGLMTHEQLANYYDFLGLSGYKKCHEYHFYDEMLDYRKVQNYFINHYIKLIPESIRDFSNIIPAAWYEVARKDVDAATRSAAVKTGMELWVKWEQDTKKFYEKKFKDLMDLGEVAAAIFVKDLLLHTTKELEKAEKYWIRKKAISYNMDVIIEEQKEKHEKYKCCICKLFENKKKQK